MYMRIFKIWLKAQVQLNYACARVNYYFYYMLGCLKELLVPMESPSHVANGVGC